MDSFVRRVWIDLPILPDEAKCGAVPAFGSVDTFLNNTPEPCDLGLDFLFALFQKAQIFPHHLAGIAETSRMDARFNEVVAVERKIQSSGSTGNGVSEVLFETGVLDRKRGDEDLSVDYPPTIH
jgi:hypothetical protein